MKRVQKRTRETEDRIRRVAERLFREQGYDKTSMDTIAEEADVAKGTVFAHFGDKANLLAAVGLTDLNDLVTRAQASAERGPKTSPVDDVMAIYQPWLDYFADNVDFAKLFINQAGLGKGPWTEQFIDACCTLENAITTLIEGWRAKGDLKHPETSAFLSEGAQAFFYTAVIYRLSDRTPDRAAQTASLRSFLAAWL